MTTLIYIFAAIGLWFTVSVALLLIWIAANERAGRRKSRTGKAVITITPDTSAFVEGIKKAQRDTEKAARQIGGWR